MTTLAELADRCEQATGPDRSIDEAIFRAVRRERDYVMEWKGADQPGEFVDLKGFTNSVPGYTASLDAAMTLVPEGWDWDVEWLGGTSVAHMLLARGTFTSAAATPALALCAAALRARSA